VKNTADDFEVDQYLCAESLKQYYRAGKMTGFCVENVHGDYFVETNVMRVEGKL
jgi:hypothetical protein